MAISYLNENYTCDFFLSQSHIPGLGRTIISGRFFEIDEVISRSPTLLVNKSITGPWQPGNYFYRATEKEFAVIVFGVGALFNHKSGGNENVSMKGSAEHASNSSDQFEAHTTLSPADYKFKTAMNAGEEIFTSYGHEGWFALRGIVPINISFVKPHNLTQLKEKGQCLSNVFVANSTYPMAGQGLFAGKNFVQGETIIVSPVLLLPFEVALETVDSSVLLNYVISKPRSKVALLPITLLAMANHKSNANMDIKWFNWDEDDMRRDEALPKNLNPDIDIYDLMDEPFAPLDIKYVANRNISTGEELTLNYGNRWAVAWSEYLAYRVQWEQQRAMACEESCEAGESAEQREERTLSAPWPVFRHPIEAPDGFFPPHWFHGSGSSTSTKVAPSYVQSEMSEDHIQRNYGDDYKEMLNSGDHMEVKEEAVHNGEKLVNDAEETNYDGDDDNTGAESLSNEEL